MVNVINETLMNAGALDSIDFVIIHNDAGSMTPEQYINWLRYRDKALGIAHYYCNKDTIARVIDTYNIGYHAGNWYANTHSIGYEVCQSMSASDEDFLENEDITLMQATEDLLFYGLPINNRTVRLHHEFSPTSCPHRSMALHGGSTESVRSYFINRMKYFASLGETVDEMLANKGEQPTVTENVEQDRNNKTISDVANEVLQGKWGNGDERYTRLMNAGYNYNEVQQRVNELVLGNSGTKKTIDEIANEVIGGQWGNGQERKNRLTGAGYNYNEVQNRVNELLS